MYTVILFILKRYENGGVRRLDELSFPPLMIEVAEKFAGSDDTNLTPLLGFGLRYRTMQLHHKDTLQKWEQAYPTLPIEVTVDVDLKSTGTID